MVPRYAGVTMATKQPCYPSNCGVELAKARQVREGRSNPSVSLTALGNKISMLVGLGDRAGAGVRAVGSATPV